MTHTPRSRSRREKQLPGTQILRDDSFCRACHLKQHEDGTRKKTPNETNHHMYTSELGLQKLEAAFYGIPRIAWLQTPKPSIPLRWHINSMEAYIMEHGIGNKASKTNKLI
jgi:hypothetical protein